jgi:APA family basic amino acid/polyamine antiporter
MVAISTMVLRRTESQRHRPFRVPALKLIGPLAVIGCAYLFWSLGGWTKMMALAWTMVGVVAYLAYGYRHSHVGREAIAAPAAGGTPPATQ